MACDETEGRRLQRHLRHLPSLRFSFYPKGCFLVLFCLRNCPVTLGSLVPCYNSLQNFSRAVVYFKYYFIPI